jgi:hypothetical protein
MTFPRLPAANLVPSELQTSVETGPGVCSSRTNGESGEDGFTASAASVVATCVRPTLTAAHSAKTATKISRQISSVGVAMEMNKLGTLGRLTWSITIPSAVRVRPQASSNIVIAYMASNPQMRLRRNNAKRRDMTAADFHDLPVRCVFVTIPPR